MSYFQRSDPGLQDETRSQPASRPRFAEIAGRVGDWFAGVDHVPAEEDGRDRPAAPRWAVDDDDGTASFDVLAAERSSVYDVAQDLGRDVGHDGYEAAAGGPREPEPEPELQPDEVAPAFPLARFGYSRVAVDARVHELERELAELRAQGRQQPISITEEIERIGEQTASILVVAHDQAGETTRRAQEQAERCIADAAANAVAMTNDAKQRLQELDAETEAVWRERERLLDDVRTVSAALATLADEASDRFPAAEPRGSHAVVASGAASPDAAQGSEAGPGFAGPGFAGPAGSGSGTGTGTGSAPG
ncbi:MAG: DivIVA domain-containing protein [Solirubrobacteraceae bacterium]|jgi:hypothetical protein